MGSGLLALNTHIRGVNSSSMSILCRCRDVWAESYRVQRLRAFPPTRSISEVPRPRCLALSCTITGRHTSSRWCCCFNALNGRLSSVAPLSQQVQLCNLPRELKSNEVLVQVGSMRNLRHTHLRNIAWRSGGDRACRRRQRSIATGAAPRDTSRLRSGAP